MERSELITGLQRRSTLTVVHGDRNSNYVLGTDIEGPHTLGDVVDQAMVLVVKPERCINAAPMYGHIIYEETYIALGGLRDLQRSPSNRGSLYSEGSDTIFPLPLLLAQGINGQFLQNLALESAATPGAKELVKELRNKGVVVYGITTAPEAPYKTFFENNGGLEPDKIAGSPFPIDETRQLLIDSGRYEMEMGIVGKFLNDCYNIIDRHSLISNDEGTLVRSFSDEGKEVLRQRALKFYFQELGISYSRLGRKTRGPTKTVLGQVIEACGMVTDRSKRAIALTALRRGGRPGASLITMGDGANDRELLKSGDLSIGVNGADAARAAQIAFVGEDMRPISLITDLFMQGQRNIQDLVAEAQRHAPLGIIIATGGNNCDPDTLKAAQNTKRKLRGLYVTY